MVRYKFYLGIEYIIMTSYCVRCRKKTGDVSPHMTHAKNGRNMLKAKCATCHGNKSEFVSGTARKGKRKAGGNILSTLAGLFL